MTDYYNLKNLPIITDNRQVMQVSSFDRKEENADFEHFLYQDKDGSQVLFDETVPGCIKSIWAAVTKEDCIIRFYFDGEKEPRYTCSSMGFFNGEIPELTGNANTFLLRGHYEEDDCRCGNCYIPIPYSKLKITAAGNTHFYYHIMYERYTDGTELSVRDGVMSEAYRNAFDGVAEVKEPTTFEEDVVIDSKYKDILNYEKPGVITEFTVEAPLDVDLSKVQLQIFADNTQIAQLACPIMYLFGLSQGYREIESLAVKSKLYDDKIVMSFYLPIIFFERINMCLYDEAKDGKKIKLRMRIEENTYNKEETGLLYGDYREGLTELYGDWLFGEFSGCGNVVGFVQTCHGDQYCEGNEHFYFNGAQTPQINGTGTEDFYLGCYWPNYKYDSPVAGCVSDIYLEGGSTLQGAFKLHSGYYRYMHDMPLYFADGVKLAIQHGAVGQTYSDYTSLVLSYRQPLPKRLETDFIRLSSKASRELHLYTFENAEEISLTAKLEGERKEPILSREGYLHKAGKVSFKIATIPENTGVCIRRLRSQNYANQSALVYVDGQFAGEWHDPGLNEHAPFADSDFYIDANLTKGKELIEITLEIPEIYSDFEYRIMTCIK